MVRRQRVALAGVAVVLAAGAGAGCTPAQDPTPLPTGTATPPSSPEVSVEQGDILSDVTVTITSSKIVDGDLWLDLAVDNLGSEDLWAWDSGSSLIPGPDPVSEAVVANAYLPALHDSGEGSNAEPATSQVLRVPAGGTVATGAVAPLPLTASWLDDPTTLIACVGVVPDSLAAPDVIGDSAVPEGLFVSEQQFGCSEPQDVPAG